MSAVSLPTGDRTTVRYEVSKPRLFETGTGPITGRVAYAAAHVVADPLAPAPNPLAEPSVDWESTLAFRRHLWSLGLGVAEAMDTAQRGSGLGWEAARELIELSCREARSVGGSIVCGVSTDQLAPAATPNLDEIVRAYSEQCDVVEEAGGVPIVMASRHLARAADRPDDYARVYRRVLADRSGPVMLHWLGGAFDPALAGYWGSQDLRGAMETVLSIISERPERVSGIKLSVLDPEVEKAVRIRLPHAVLMLTGDDFNFMELIRGDGGSYSHALLGAFDPLAPAAAAALRALDAGDVAGYDELLGPCVPLARKIFEAPTADYKVGVVLMAWLNGHQSHFRMIAGLESTRSVVHLSEVFKLADQAGLLADADLAVSRMRSFLEVSGVAQP